MAEYDYNSKPRGWRETKRGAGWLLRVVYGIAAVTLGYLIFRLIF